MMTRVAQDKDVGRAGHEADDGKRPDACQMPPAHGGVLDHPKVKAVGAILFACALTLCMGGYQFGESNHTVYLLDALRHVHP